MGVSILEISGKRHKEGNELRMSGDTWGDRRKV